MCFRNILLRRLAVRSVCRLRPTPLVTESIIEGGVGLIQGLYMEQGLPEDRQINPLTAPLTTKRCILYIQQL